MSLEHKIADILRVPLENTPYKPEDVADAIMELGVAELAENQVLPMEEGGAMTLPEMERAIKDLQLRVNALENRLPKAERLYIR